MGSPRGLRLNFSHLVWVFALSCLLGYAVETLWCLVRLGRFESRQSLIYGPLSVAYGLGGLALTVTLYKFQRANLWKLFVIAFAVGSAVEYICSYGQEMFFNSVAWDYSHLPFNLHGRICLFYSVFWGLLGVFWAKVVYPGLNFAAERLSPGACRRAALVFTAFFALDCAVTLIAVIRMDQRSRQIAPRNAIEHMLDEHFPDERIQAVYANSVPVD